MTKRPRRFRPSGAALAALGLALAPIAFAPGAPLPAAAQEPARATLVLHWSPQSQFAGYYVAMEKGFYRDRGVELTLIDGGPRVDGAAMVREGRADFATLFLTGALEAVADGVPLRLVSQVVNASLVLLVARRDAGIEGLADLQGRRVSLWARHDLRAPFEVFFSVHGLDVDVAPQYHSVNLFLQGGVDACAAMRYNELYRIYLAGIDFEELAIFPVEPGPDRIPEDGLYARADYLRDHPAVARAVAEASMEGWRYAAAHPAEALDIVMRRVRAAHVPVSRVHMRWMLETILPAILDPGGDGRAPGRLAPADYRHTVELLERAGVIAGAPAYRAFTWREPAP